MHPWWRNPKHRCCFMSHYSKTQISGLRLFFYEYDHCSIKNKKKSIIYLYVYIYVSHKSGPHNNLFKVTVCCLSGRPGALGFRVAPVIIVWKWRLQQRCAQAMRQLTGLKTNSWSMCNSQRCGYVSADPVVQLRVESNSFSPYSHIDSSAGFSCLTLGLVFTAIPSELSIKSNCVNAVFED